MCFVLTAGLTGEGFWVPVCKRRFGESSEVDSSKFIMSYKPRKQRNAQKCKAFVLSTECIHTFLPESALPFSAVCLPACLLDGTISKHQ